MGMYQIEQQYVEQEVVWQDIRTYVERHALTQPFHEVEKDLFRLLLALGLKLLKEVVARHGTGRTGAELPTGDGSAIPYHGLKSRQYLSIFGTLGDPTRVLLAPEPTGLRPLGRDAEPASPGLFVPAGPMGASGCHPRNL